jgi:hypothetical protein
MDKMFLIGNLFFHAENILDHCHKWLCQGTNIMQAKWQNLAEMLVAFGSIRLLEDRKDGHPLFLLDCRDHFNACRALKVDVFTQSCSCED